MANNTVQPGAGPANPSRRSALGILATGPVAMLPALAVMQCSAPAEAALADLEAELAGLAAARVDLQGRHATQREWDRWGHWQDSIFRKIEGLPLTPANARIRALAVRELYPDDHEMDDLFQGDTTDARLARQLIQSLWRA